MKYACELGTECRGELLYHDTERDLLLERQTGRAHTTYKNDDDDNKNSDNNDDSSDNGDHDGGEFVRVNITAEMNKTTRLVKS